MSRKKVWESAIKANHMVKVYRDTDSDCFSVRVYKFESPAVTLVGDSEEDCKASAIGTGLAMLDQAIAQAAQEEADKRADALAAMSYFEIHQAIDALMRVHMLSAAAELVNELDRRKKGD